MKYYGLEYLRFILALSVMFFHSLGYFGIYDLSFFSLGVDVFFVISGVVLVLSTYNNKNSIYFLYKRIKRIYPLFIIVTIATIISYLVIGKSYELSIARDFLMIPSFYNDGSIHLPIVYQAWTLQFEFMFYIICFFFLCFIKNNKVYLYIITFLLFLLLTTIILMIFNINTYGISSFVFSDNFIFLEFSAGISLGLLFKNQEIKLNNKIGFVLLIIGVILLYITWIINSDLEYRGLYFSLSSFLIVFSFMIFNVKNKKLALLLGSLSYPMYLGHQLVNYSLSTIFGSYVLNSDLKIFFLVIIEMFVSIIFAYILLKIEYSIMKKLFHWNVWT